MPRMPVSYPRAQKDSIASVVVSALIGAFLSLTLGSLFQSLVIVIIAGCGGFVVSWAILVASRTFFSKTPTVFQAIKFAAVGVSNTVVDLGIINMLMFITGIAMGWWFSFFKAIGFFAALANSYVWNHTWTFDARAGRAGKTIIGFVIVSAGGFLINVGAASILVNAVPRFLEISPQAWATIGSIAAVLFSMVWNFVGYKFFVFKDAPGKPTAAEITL